MKGRISKIATLMLCLTMISLWTVASGDMRCLGENYDPFQAMLGATLRHGNMIVIPPGTYKIWADVTVPEDVTLLFMPGGMLDIEEGKTVRVEGELIAGLRQIKTGAGDLSLAPGSCRYVLAQWFGAIGNDGADCHDAIETAISVAHGGGSGPGTVHFPAGVYRISAPIDRFPYGPSASHNTGVVLQGAGMDHTVLKYTGAADYAVKLWHPDLATANNYQTVQYVTIRDLQIDARDADGGIDFVGCQSCMLENVAIHEIDTDYGKAIHAQRSHFTIVEDGMTHDVDRDFTTTGKYAAAFWVPSKVAGPVVKATVRLKKAGSPAGTITASLYTNVAGKPGALIGAPSEIVACNDLSSDADGADQDFQFLWGGGASVIGSTWYWIVLETDGYTYSDGVSEVMLRVQAAGAAGNHFGTFDGSWSVSNDGTNHTVYVANKNMQFNHLHRVQIRGAQGANARYGIYMEDDSQFDMTHVEVNAKTPIMGVGAVKIWASESKFENDGEAEPLHFQGAGAATFFGGCYIENPTLAHPLWFAGGLHYFLNCLITGYADWEQGTQVHFQNCSGPVYVADDPGMIARDFDDRVYIPHTPYWEYGDEAGQPTDGVIVSDPDALSGYCIRETYSRSAKLGFGGSGTRQTTWLPRGLWRVTLVAKHSAPDGDDLGIFMNQGTPGVGITITNEHYPLTTAYERYEAILVIDKAIIAGKNNVYIWFQNITAGDMDISHVEMKRIGVDEAPVDLLMFNPNKEDTDGGRDSRLVWQGRQSGGEQSFLATIVGSHDLSGDDERGKLVISTNGGGDGFALTPALEVGSDQILNFIGTMGDSTKSPAADSVADWIEVKVNGATYYIPVYAP